MSSNDSVPNNGGEVERLRIAMISRGDASSGGAGRVAEILATGLVGRGHEVVHFVRRRARPEYRPQTRFLPGIKGDVAVRNLIGVDASGVLLLAQRELWDADIIHFHDYSVAFGAQVAFQVQRRKPVVFTLHDFSGLTGGCLNPGECRQFSRGCGRCPQIGQWPLQLPVDRTSAHFELHRRIAATRSAVAIAPSEYLASHARTGAWKEGVVQVIPNVVDSSVFVPELRSAGRAKLKLEPGAVALLFVAADVMHPLKGFLDLAEAFVRMAALDPRLHLVIAGEMAALPLILLPFADRVRRCGLVKSSTEMAEIYAAVECYVTTSRAETFHLGIIEAMSCGTPVVAYPTGGIPETFEHGLGGWLVPTAEPRALEECLRTVLETCCKTQTRELARRYILSRYSMENFLSSHERIYRVVLQNRFAVSA